ncbi:hypothetical protein FS837_006271 [Tulasnella sp. UAMH 9824]|nr:hypothetical protein FS837_006271 [Tulasnella sp. UAMH 9824]
MSDDRWDAFWAYCRRVRTLKSRGAGYLTKYIYHLKSQVANRLSGPCLLPNLRYLSIKLWGGYELCQVLPIAPAELRVLKVGTQGGGRIQSLLEFLTAIPLSGLSVIHFYDLTLVGVDVSGLGRSGTFLQPSGLATFLQQNYSTLVVLQLGSFQLTASDLKRIGGFPKATTLGLWHKGSAKELNKFFNVIAPSFPKLCSLEIILDLRIKKEVSVAVFEDLEACRDLKILFLRSRLWEKLTREDVSRFGSSWPLMELFNLAQSQHHPGQATNPLGILQGFAWVWSRTLRSIALPFDGSAPLPSLSTVDFKFEKLVEMDAGRSYISESSVESVAEFLRAISPGYLDIMASVLVDKDEDEDDYAPLWDAVRERVNAEVAVHLEVVPT